MTEQLALPGVPAVDPRREEWRAHTAERWQSEDPESYAECCECIRRGELNKTRLAHKFRRSRNSILSLTMREFTVEQLQSLNGKRAAMVVGEAMEQMDTLIEDADADQLGALSMAAKQASDIAQVTSGGPTEIREDRHILTVEQFSTLVLGTGLEGGEMSAMGRSPGPVIEADVAPSLTQGDTPSLSESLINSSKSAINAAVMLAFMLVPMATSDWLPGGEGVGLRPLTCRMLIHCVT